MKRYADDYVNEITLDEKGRERKKAVYRGAFYNFLLEEPAYKQLKLRYYLLAAGLIAALVGMGFVANQGMYKFYVTLPYTFCYFPLLYLVMGLLRLPARTSRLQRDQVGLSHDRVKLTSLLLSIFLGVGFLGELVYLIFFSRGQGLAQEILFAALEAVALGMALFIWLTARKIKVELAEEPSFIR